MKNKTYIIRVALIVALGGFWYLILSMSASLLLPKIQTDQLFVSIIEKTSEFLKVRGELLVCKTNREVLYHKMFELQTQINESHESIREIILSKRTNSGFSNRTRRQQLLFSELIEILEDANDTTLIDELLINLSPIYFNGNLVKKCRDV